MTHDRASPLRCLLVWLAATAMALGLGRALVADLLDATLGSADVETALTALCEALLAGCVAWAWAATTAVVGEVLLGAHRGRGLPGVPHLWRRWVLIACGAALAAGLAAPAQATPGAVHLDPHGRHADQVPSLSGLPMPDRPVSARRTTPAQVRPPAPAPAPAPLSDTVVVQPGDSLWSIAAADLGPRPDDVETATRWRAIYDANRDVIGPDPDLVVPGEQLHLPPTQP